MLTRRRLLVLGALILVGSYLTAGGLGVPTLNPAEENTPSDDTLVEPIENESKLWPYTSRGKTTKQRTLATNVIIIGDDTRIKRLLTQQSKLRWEIAREDESANETTNGTATGTADGTDAGTTNETGFVDAPTPVAANETNVTVSNDTDTQPVTLQRRGLGWSDTHGATRYTYIDARPAGGQAGWVKEAYQIHAGEYFGSRSHIRAYTTPATNWTAIQIHREYFDWFRLRHTVTGIQPSRNALESNFLEKPFVEEVRREYHGVNRGWNDGWLSEIQLVSGAALLLLMSLFTRDTHRSIQEEGRRFVGWVRDSIRGFVLGGALIGLVLGVRSSAIFFENTFPAADPKLMFAALYPMLALGLPILAFVLAQPLGATDRFERSQHIAKRLGRPLDALPAFGFAFLGLTLAFVLDFGGIGVSRIPVQLVLHRVGLACALGLIAAGSTHIDERGAGLLVIGIAGWLVGLAMPLAGYI
jgi:hypothetical protein